MSDNRQQGEQVRREVMGDAFVDRALNNGCTVAEIREALLHCAVYAGVPAAIDAFRAAQEVIDAWQAPEA